MTSLYDVLKAQKLPTNDAYAGLMAKALKGSEIKEYTGSVPYTFTANGQPLIDWRISGASGGVGDRTANLLDVNATDTNNGYVSEKYLTSNGALQTPSSSSSSIWYVSEYIDIHSYNHITLSGLTGTSSNPSICFYNINHTYISGVNYAARMIVSAEVPSTAQYMRVSFTRNRDYMLSAGSTALPYEPYGFKIPVSCGGTTKNIYLGEPLAQGDSISKASTGIDIPTADGSNTLSLGTAVQPSGVYIKYRR